MNRQIPPIIAIESNPTHAQARLAIPRYGLSRHAISLYIKTCMGYSTQYMYVVYNVPEWYLFDLMFISTDDRLTEISI